MLVLRCGRLICSYTPYHDKNPLPYKVWSSGTSVLAILWPFIPANNLKAELGKLEGLSGQNCRTTLEQSHIALGLATESCSTSTKACQGLQHEPGSPALRTYDGTANFGAVFCSAPRPSQIDILKRDVQNPAAHSVRPVDRDDTIGSFPRSFETCMHGSTGQEQAQLTIGRCFKTVTYDGGISKDATTVGSCGRLGK